MSEHPFTRPEGSEADVFIQWKGTEVCMDFTCPCGAEGHVDASFAYFVHCPSCDTVFELGTQVIVKRNDEGRDRAIDLEVDWRRRNSRHSFRVALICSALLDRRLNPGLHAEPHQRLHDRQPVGALLVQGRLGVLGDVLVERGPVVAVPVLR